MPDIVSFASSADLSVESLVSISEAQVTSRDSAMFKHIVAQVSEKLVALQRMRAADDGKKRGDRTYIPYHLEAAERYRLGSVFPQFDIRYTIPSPVSVPYARAVSLMVSEYLLSFVPRATKGVVALGFSMVPTVMRNRNWLHLCVPAADPVIQAMHLEQDRSLMAIRASYLTRGNSPPPYLEGYVTRGSEAVNFCTHAHSCDYSSSVVVAVLDQVDTNFRQFAVWMHTHGASLGHFAIPANKAMEMGFDGPFPELQGHVAYTPGRVSIVYPGDGCWQQHYTHENYLELIARQRVILYGRTYFKEYVGEVSGYRHYKVTATNGVHSDTVLPYKSWTDPGYKDKYIMRVPRLKPQGRTWRAKDWEMLRDAEYVPVAAAVIDNVLTMALRADDKKMDTMISRRLFSTAFNIIVDSKLTRQENTLGIQEFTDALYTVYVEAFMRKFASGAATAVVGPEARGLAVNSRLKPFAALTSAVSSYLRMSSRNTTELVAEPLRRWYDAACYDGEVILPSYVRCPGYVEYGEKSGSNPRFRGWDVGESPFDGFSQGLPGGGMLPGLVVRAPVPVTVLDFKPERTPLELFASVATGVKAAFQALVRSERATLPGFRGRRDEDDFAEYALAGLASEEKWELPSSVAEVEEKPVAISSLPARDLVGVRDTLRRVPLGVRTISAGVDPAAYDEYTEKILERIESEVPLTRDFASPFVYHALLVPGYDIVTRPGAVSTDPLEDFKMALDGIFPGSRILDTSNTEHHRLHSRFEVTLKTILMKVDLSKLDELKPEAFFRPVLRGHALPNVKETPINTLATLAKRNADTPYNVDPMDGDELWGRIKRALFKVFYVEGAEQWLEAQPYVGPSEEGIREWCQKQTPEKLERLTDPERGYSVSELMLNTRNMNLMLKGRLKPEMDASYETALKMPQTIQYDATGRSVLFLSPVVREKVKREAFMLRPNVLLMQRKSYEDLCRFVNQFDWRPDQRGERWYIEIDETMFDKSQTRELSDMYLRKLQMFKVLPEVVGFIGQHMDERTVASVKAGVLMKIIEQNASGAAFTLDRNNAVSEESLVILIEEILSQVEFIIMQGDDVTIAVRGRPNVAHWERFLNRMFNLSAKVSVRRQGNICSYDLIHRADGSTVPVRCLVKALVGLMRQDLKDEEKFVEQFVSMTDSMRYVNDAETQVTGSRALAERWRETFPHVDAGMFYCLFRAFSGVLQGSQQLRRLYSETKEVRR
jgi:hypothetical protein